MLKPVLCTVQVYLSEDELARGDEAGGHEEGGQPGDGDVDLPRLLGEAGQHHAVLQVVKTHPLIGQNRSRDLDTGL